jgi:endonuclease/exonuclease/phosphatase family metal-dependent hydrolase
VLAVSSLIAAANMVGVSNVLRVLSFNTWKKGRHVHNGFDKIVNHIRAVNPDIVGLQELDVGSMNEILHGLGDGWFGMQNDHGKFPAGIVTRHHMDMHSKVILSSDRGIGCDITVQIDEITMVIHVWSVHIDSSHYGPYYAHNSKFESSWEEMAFDKSARLAETRELIAIMSTVPSENGDSTLVIGDFNEPSHLDWITNTQKLHGNRSFNWPVSQIMAKEGFLDAFRVVKPNPLLDPGNTWSPIFKTATESGYDYQDHSQPEPQDRIDFIYYKSKSLIPVSGELYNGNGHNMEIPNHANNDWPSDHYALITDFRIANAG